MATSQVDQPPAPLAPPTPSALTTFLAVAAPNATAFMSSMCIMTVELVAGRLIARNVGSSIYTWTSVIGVVLAGIAAGNWAGGRIADRYQPRQALAILFTIGSIACLTIPGLNKIIGNWAFLWKQEWPVRIASHVFLVFFLPSAVLGCIGPVAAKMALDLGRQVGRTVGSVYAWGALGSIVGTFLTGFVLISHMGTVAVLVSAAAVMALVALLYGARTLFPTLWAGVTVAFLVCTMGPWPWARKLGTELGVLREAYANVIYVDESQYSYIQIEEEEDPPSLRSMSLDHLIHAYVVMDNQTELHYDYELLYASITENAIGSKDGNRIRSLFLGGGGFVYPRYMLAKWPNSYVEVAELDPRVTEAAHAAFGLPRDSPMKIYNLDARNHVDDLLQRRREGENVPPFDLVFGDAFNHYAVPHHLTTREFNEKLKELMAPDGVYMMNIIDIYDSGRFLGAILNTFRETFPHVYAFSTYTNGPSNDPRRRDTFVVVGALQPLKNASLRPDVPGAVLKPEHFETLRRRSRNIILTDDYAPVEQMLEPVVRRADKEG
jgi:spermidine synthase